MKRVDMYWAEVLKRTDPAGLPRYGVLGKLVKDLLSPFHGNADV